MALLWRNRSNIPPPLLFYDILYSFYLFLNMQNLNTFNRGLLCPFLQNVIYVSGVPRMCLKFQLKIPHISFIISFWKCLFWVEAETRSFCTCIFKCKWAAASRTLFLNSAVPLQLIPQIFCQIKKHLLKSSISNQLKRFRSACIRSTLTESGCYMACEH